MDYIEVSLKFKPNEETSEIVTAFLSLLPFESFQATNSGLKAFIKEQEFKLTDLQGVMSRIPIENISFQYEPIQQVNWNEEWEKNFDPIQINEKCIVRAPFHKAPTNLEYDIIIMPKMSFGTGHHATTKLMIRSLLDEPLDNKRVLDAGCGTGVLSIMAEKLLAQKVLAYDIDEWAVINSRENVNANNCKNIDVEKGSVKDIQPDGFDVILANINKNVLLSDIPLFSDKLVRNGSLILSGFYEKDCEDIVKLAELNQLKIAHIATLDKWALIKMVKLV